uniref:Uncharacterized protein n=1 Tax=Setaria italica TaxID=4555 RepID=K3ZPN3_SETIT
MPEAFNVFDAQVAQQRLQAQGSLHHAGIFQRGNSCYDLVTKVGREHFAEVMSWFFFRA